MATTELSGQTVVTDALTDIGVYGVGQTLQASDANRGLRKLNAMVSSLGLQPLAKLVVAREVFTPTANVASYTIGPGATFNTTRPVSIQNAALLLNSSTPAVEIPVGILTDQAYQAIPIKTLTNTLFTNIYYQPTFTTTGWGTIILWPVPTTAVNQLVIYTQQSMIQFADLTTTYFWPEGAEEMLVSNLALRLCFSYARPVPDELRRLAGLSLANFKRANVRQVDMANDAAMIGSSGRWGYDINSDTIR